MKGDFSRLSFDPVKRYSSVRQQQGRVLLDADWNEQQDILNQRLETGTHDQLGRLAVPRQEDFRLRVVQSGGVFDLAVGPGRAYVDGIQVEQEGGRVPVVVTAAQELQPPSLLLDGRELAAGQWLEVSGASAAPVAARIGAVDPSQVRVVVDQDLSAFQGAGSAPQIRRLVTYTTQPDLPGVGALPAGDGRFLAYLDVWRRHITALEDPEIVELALGGPDTTTRIKTVWQLKLQEVGSGAQCGDFDTFAPASGGAPGRLRARVAGVTALENQLYRVEVHQGGDESSATFKWSRDNGVVVGQISGVGVQSIAFTQAVRDEERQFEAGQWVEVSNDEKTLAGEPGYLVEVTGVDGLELDILGWPTPDEAPPALGTHPVVRAWSSEGQVEVKTGTYLPLEDGLEVSFEAGAFRTGDYWLMATRRESNSVLWPTDSAGVPLPQEPHGVAHGYMPLALLQRSGGAWSIASDCRRVVPPLADVAKSKVDRAGDTITGKLTLLDELEVEGNTALRSALAVGGNATVDQSLTVKGQLTVDQSAQIGGPLTAVGNLSALANLAVAGSATVSGAATMSANLTVNGPAVLNNTLRVNQAATLQAGLAVTGDTTLQALTAAGAATLQNGLAVNGAVNVQGEVKSTVGGRDFFMVPRGGIIMWSGSLADVPPGWVLCNGQNGTPDLRNRFVAGAGGEYAPGAQGGAREVTLSIEQMPAHSHSYIDVYFSEHVGSRPNDNWVGNPANIGSGDTDYDNVGYFENRDTRVTGGGQVHENRPPYYALAFIMKT
jgi:hypothetical protein